MKKLLPLLGLLLTSFCSYAQVNPPTAVKARQDGTENKALVQWTAPTGPAVSGYKVYYKIKGATKYDSVRTATTSSTLSQLTLDTAYVVHVKAFNAKVAPVDTTYSTNKDTVVVVIAKPLTKPSIEIDTELTTDTSITFKLIDNVNIYETGYEITIVGGGSTKNITSGPVDGNTIIEVKDLKPKTEYTITAKAVRTLTEGTFPASSPSDAQKETTKVALPPEAIAFVTNADCPYGVAFSWDYAQGQEDIVYVDIEASTDGWNFTTVGAVTQQDKMFYFVGAEPGQVYFYRVVTHNATGTTRSGPYEIFTQRYVAANPPTNVRSLKEGLNKYSTWLTAAWDHGAQDMACKTNILVNTQLRISVNGGEWKVIADLPNYVQQYRIENLSPGDIVQISLRAQSDKGLYSDWVTTVDTTYGPPTVPDNFVAVEGLDSFGNRVMHLSWQDTKDEGQYFIERSVDNNLNFQPFAFLKQDVVRLTDTHLEEGRSYFYRIRATNWVGESNWNTKGPFFVSYTSAPNAPFGLVAKRNGNGVDLTWIDDSIKEENYYVEKSSDGGANFVIIATLGRDAEKARDENVSAGNTYIYRVRAWNAAFGYSSYSKPATITLPQAANALVLDATVYPNPASEFLGIRAEGVTTGSTYQLRIFDSNNHEVLNKAIQLKEGETSQVGIQSLVPGSYTLVISSGKEKIAKKLIKL